MAASVAFFSLDDLPSSRRLAPDGDDAFCEVVAGAMSAPSRPDSTFPPVLTEHEVALTRRPASAVRPLGFYRLNDVLFGGRAYCLRGGAVCASPTVLPDYWRRMVEADPDLLPSVDRLARRALDRPALLLISRDYNNFGHWWLDIAPRLHALRHHGGAWLADLAVVVPADLATWCREMLSDVFGLRPDQFVRYDPQRELMVCRTAILPTMVHTNYRFHPAAQDFYQHLAAWAGDGRPAERPSRLLYITRSDYAHREVTKRVRQLANVADAEAMAMAMGFEVIAPERLSWREQAALFAQARVVAGEHGSAMKNLLFAPSGTVAVIINCLNGTQASIAALNAQHYLVVQPEGFDPADHSVPYTVNLDTLRACLEHAMRVTA
jgi:capsular polysaccharide biosynthesis protein